VCVSVCVCHLNVALPSRCRLIYLEAKWGTCALAGTSTCAPWIVALTPFSYVTNNTRNRGLQLKSTQDAHNYVYPIKMYINVHCDIVLTTLSRPGLATMDSRGCWAAVSREADRIILYHDNLFTLPVKILTMCC